MLYDSSAASKIVPDLGHVQETLLIPPYARARDATRRHPVLHDERAAALVNSLEYDFSRFGGPSLLGCVLRSAILDGWVRRFMTQHPAATVVELGSGLDTRFDRLDND
jgi:O-methyltransferase involved in polyketide biosynthesis